MPRILFDVTRLYTRKRAATPSGIDRVDLRYLEHIEAQHQSQYVLAWLGCYFLAEKRQVRTLQSGLRSKWQGRTAAALPTLLQLLAGQWPDLLRAALFNLLPASWGLRHTRSARLQRFLLEQTERWLFLNTSHIQIRSIAALRQLDTTDKLDYLFFLHDLIPLTHPEYVRPGGATQHQQRLELLIYLSAYVICNSNYTREEFIDWVAKRGQAFSTTQIEVLPIGVEAGFMQVESQAPPLGEPYFLMLGTIEPRKNHLLVLNVWRRMVEQGVAQIPRLVIIGKRGWENENIIDMLERCDAIQPYVIEQQHVSDMQLQAWLQHCVAMIYPSFVEGWGMPVAEALAMGVPVICSDIPPFREVGQGIAHYIDPLDGPALMAEVQRLMQLPRGHIKADYQPPTWEAHLAQLDELVAQITGAGEAM